MNDEMRQFNIIGKFGSLQVFGPPQWVEERVLEFLANIDDFCIGVVPADAPKKREG